MTNLEALSRKCTYLFPSFYPDFGVLEFLLEDSELKTGDEYSVESRRKISILAIKTVSNNVETSHSEGGISSAVDLERAKANIRRECEELGIDASIYVELSTIDDQSDSW